jgi:hypothetical protein
VHPARGCRLQAAHHAGLSGTWRTIYDKDSLNYFFNITINIYIYIYESTFSVVNTWHTSHFQLNKKCGKKKTTLLLPSSQTSVDIQPVCLNLSAMVQCFSLTTNQPTILSTMTYQPSEQAMVFVSVKLSYV